MIFEWNDYELWLDGTKWSTQQVVVDTIQGIVNVSRCHGLPVNLGQLYELEVKGDAGLAVTAWHSHNGGGVFEFGIVSQESPQPLSDIEREFVAKWCDELNEPEKAQRLREGML